MATSTKKVTSTTTATTDSVDLQKENNDLRSELNSLKEQMQLLMSQMLMNNANVAKPTEQEDDPLVEVISLTNGSLILSTNGRSDGRIYRLNKQFDVKNIPASDLKLIVNAMPHTTEEGYYFINDTDFVKKNRLSNVYTHLMGVKEIKEIFSKPYNEFIAAYQAASRGQKSIIESMVTDKKLNGEFVDANILLELGKITGKNYMDIEPLPKEG